MPLPPRAVRRLTISAVALNATLGTGCYDYAPLARPGGTLPAREVELALTDSGSVIVARTVGPASTAIDGTLVADSAGSYVLAVRRVRRRDAEPATWSGERVTVAHALVSSVRERRLSRTRTTLTVLGTAAAVVLARLAIAGRGGSNSGSNNGGGTGGVK